MNRIATTPRGFPFDEKTLAELQEQTVPVLNALARLIPDRSIVYGCTFNFEEMRYNSGFIVWDGELLPFQGGPPGVSFSIVEEVQERAFNTGTDQDPQLEDHPAYVKRYAINGVVEGAESVHLRSQLNGSPRFLTYLLKGRRFLGTIVPTFDVVQLGTTYQINFPESVGVSNYMVLGNFYRVGSPAGAFVHDIYDKTATGFKLRIQDVAQPVGGLFFDYLILPPDIYFNLQST